MDELNLDRTIRETLHTCAQGLKAPGELDTRVKFALSSGEPRRRGHMKSWKKRVISLAAVAALAVTGAVAGGGVASWSSNSWLDDSWTDFGQTAAYAEKHDLAAKYVESFSNGFLFEKGYESTTSKQDENGNELGSFTGIMLDYGKDGVRVTANIEPVQEEGSYSVNDSAYGTFREIGGVRVRYYAMPMLVLPTGTKPTAEEQAAMDRGEINIAYDGPDTQRTELTWYAISWIEDGISYSISAHEGSAGLTEDDFFQMAREMIEA